MKHILLLSLICSLSLAAVSQKCTLKGVVTSADGQPAAFVSVSVPSVRVSTQTDEDGRYFLLNLNPGTTTVVISYVGLASQQKDVGLEPGKPNELSFVLTQNSKQLDNVVVSGDKTSTRKSAGIGKAGLSPLDNPQSVGIISSTVIRDQQVLRLGDVVKNVSGVSLTQQRQGVAETFSARGYSIGIGGGTGSIFKNGITTNTGGFPEASTLESIEVLKGSSALLYGNTSGGVIINMVTKKPKFNWGGEVSMRAGSHDLYKPIVDLYGPLSKKLAFRVVSTFEKANSFRDGVKTQRVYVNPSLLYRLDNKTNILLQGDYLDSDFTPDNGIGILNQNMDAVIPASRSRFINTSWAYYNSKTASGSLTVDHNFSDAWKLNFIAAAQSVNISSFGTGVPNSVAANGDWNRSLSRAGSKEVNQTLQANLTGKFKTASISHQLLIGSDYVGIQAKTDAFRITSSSGVVGTAYDKINILDPGLYTPRTDIPNSLDTARTIAPSYRLGYYGQDLISITSKWKVLLGVRWNYLESRASRTENHILDTIVRGSSTVNRAFSPKGALIYQPTEDMSLYATYSNSFTTNTGTDINGNPLDPSIIDQFELGWKNLLFGGKLAANLSVYRILNSNLAQQAITLVDGSPNTNANIRELTGETTSDGFEIDLNGTVTTNIYFMAGYGYNNARYTASSGMKGAVMQGEKLINNPAHTANATIFYTFDQASLKGLKIGFSAFYTGKRFGGVQNTVDQTPAYNRQVTLSGFTTVDFSAGYTLHKITLLAKLSNIGNTLNYLAHDRYSINPIPPRQIVATVGYRF